MSNQNREFTPASASAGFHPPAVSAETAAATDASNANILHGAAPYVMLGLALIGIAVASYDSAMIYNGQALWCPPPIDGCNEVAGSPYARIFDLPVGYYGVVYYLSMFGLAALLAVDPCSRGLRVGALLYAALGVLFSIYFMVLQISFIRAFCIYCLVSAVTTVLLTATAAWHSRAGRMETSS